MHIETLTPPAADTLLLDEVRGHLRLDGADDDAGLATLARTAEGLMENYLGAALVARDVALYLDGFPALGMAVHECWWQGTREGPINWLHASPQSLPLPLRPLISIASIEIWQAEGWQTWDASNYSTSSGRIPLLHLTSGVGWPAPARARSGIRITARVGFGENWNAVPEVIRHAMLQLVAYLYTHRGDEGADDVLVSSGAAQMVNAYRQVKL
ncbi:head-tail connector protein [Kordiimonas sp.]|uniref:head-tail connector protein n=1 Tax=Kordiimonas sp. TaxID=1970157 RepID=UPI003A94B0CC